MLLVFLFILSIAITLYLLIVGANKYKTENEINIDDELQMEYLKQWRNKNESK